MLFLQITQWTPTREKKRGGIDHISAPLTNSTYNWVEGDEIAHIIAQDGIAKAIIEISKG